MYVLFQILIIMVVIFALTNIIAVMATREDGENYETLTDLKK